MPTSQSDSVDPTPSASTGGSGPDLSADLSPSSPPARGSPDDARRVTPKWLGKKIGRFRLQALLGHGAVGRVFRAEDTVLHRRVALKVIVAHGQDGQVNRAADQFLTEARAAAALEHPNVVQIFEAGESGNLCYLAMELLDGGNLKDLVEASGPMDPGRACQLIADAADGLAAGHAAGIVHRDLKPANLMLTRQGRCKVTDFGLATFGDADSVSPDRGAGTPLFAAPEVIRGAAADEQSDLYSLAATLFYLLAGRPPYPVRRRADALRAHVDEPVPDLRLVRPGLPESLAGVVDRGLAKDPGRRFASAEQFARVLRVQTIPAGPAPAAVMPDPGASGRLSASTGTLGGPAASGPITPVDLPAAGRRPAFADDPPADAQPIAYATPAPSRATPWRVAMSAALVAAVLAPALVGLRALWHTSAPAPTPAVAPAVTAPPAAVVPSSVPVPAGPPPIVPTDVDRLTRIATGTDPDHADRTATVSGTAAAAAPSPSGRRVRVSFDGTPFTVVYEDQGDLFDRMARQFGGFAGTGLAGRAVRVTGTVEMHQGAPQLVVTSPEQVTVVPTP